MPEEDRQDRRSPPCTLLTTTLIFGGNFAEAYCVANDLEQAQGRVFQAVKRIVREVPAICGARPRSSPTRSTFPATGATIQAIASDYAGAAGANPIISLLRRTVGLHQRALSSPVGRDDAAADAQDRLSLDHHLRGLRGRERAAGEALQARPRAAADRPRSLRR